jgi:hypothetical protein
LEIFRYSYHYAKLENYLFEDNPVTKICACGLNSIIINKSFFKKKKKKFNFKKFLESKKN